VATVLRAAGLLVAVFRAVVCLAVLLRAPDVLLRAAGLLAAVLRVVPREVDRVFFALVELLRVDTFLVLIRPELFNGPREFIAAFTAEAGENFMFLEAAIFTAAPVCGFLPVRALREDCLKVPKP